VGRTLLELIPKDGLPVPLVIRYAVQMAEALSAAHAAGIMHRDLKPANVMVTSSGLVKLLDFGLAKLIDRPVVDDTADTVTRIDAPLTVEGTMMGTVNYMSPEQVEGRKLDARSDIFSCGAVLYEMVTGRCAFKGSSAIATLSAVLRDDVQPIAEIAPDVPLELDRLVETCLRKDPDQRFQSMGEVEAVLAVLKRQSDTGTLLDAPTVRTVRGIVPPPPDSRRTSKVLAVALTSVLLAAAAFGGGYWWMNRRGSAPAAQSPPRPATPATERTVNSFSLNNDSIIEMVAAKVAPDVIVSQIRASKTNFNLSAAEVIRLSKAGVPGAVIEAMRDPNAPSPPITIPVVLGDASPIRLTLSEDVLSDAAEGDAVRFQVAHDVRVGDTVVIPKGAEAVGAIVDGAKKKMLILTGKITFRLDTVDAVGGQKVTIRATEVRRKDGSSKRQLNTGGGKSKNVAAAAGDEYMGYVDGATTVVVKK
jgi:hypothetical protein